MFKRPVSRIILSSALLVTVHSGIAASLGRVWTYQGQLKMGGVPVNGTADFEFELWDACAAGNLVAAALVQPSNVSVVNGLFTVPLDFGANAFNGDARCLAVRVRSPGGAGAFTPLSERQPVNVAPYALQTRGIFVEDAGNVGIGTTSPAHQLEVVGSGDPFRVGNANSWFRMRTGANSRLSIGDGSGSEAGFISGGHNAAVQNVLNIAACTNAGSCPTFTTFHESGNVGIGDSTPAASLTVGNGDKFQVSGSRGDVTFTDDLASITFPAADATNAPMIQMFDSGTANSNRMVIAHSSAFTDWGLQYQDAGDEFHFLSNGVDVMNVDLGNQRVGIGNVEPGYLLDVGGRMRVREGGGSAGIWFYQSTPANDRAFLGMEDDTTVGLYGGTGAGWEFVMNTTTGFVGIGTTAPEYKLHVRGGSDTEPGSGGYVVIGSTAGANISIDDNEIMARNNGATSTLFLNNDGGTVRVPVLEITGADMAEKFPVSEEVKPGMVVQIDRDNPGQLCLARGAYNRRVAGVVSGANGLSVGVVLGHLPGLEGAPPIAMSGRVWVHCDATNGPIQPGDLLTTSDKPGHAMKVLDYPRAQGAIIGKAMSGLNLGETGLVLTLISLQ